MTARTLGHLIALTISAATWAALALVIGRLA